MKTKFFKILSAFSGIILALSFLANVNTAFAATPVLSVSQNGNSATLTISNADHNAVVYLYQRQSASSWSLGTNIGQTDGNGSLTTTQSFAFDGSSNPLLLYVVVDSLSSPTVQLSPGSCSSGCVAGTLTLSQTSVSLSTGQTATITATSGSNGVSVSSNTNSSAASVIVSGSQIIITGQTTGTTTVTVCVTGSTSQCGNILVAVNGATSTSLSFSNSNPVLSLSQSQSVTIYSPNGNSSSYYISSNSSSNQVTATITGSTLFLYGQAVGSSTLNICQSGGSLCGSLTVSVSPGSSGIGGISISPTTLTLTAGQTGTATVSNSVADLSISVNTNSSVVSAGVSGKTITVYAIAAGTSTLTICQNGYSGCPSLYVVVGRSGSGTNGSGGISFSNSSPVLSIGQNQSIAIYSADGATAYSISSNSNSSVASLSLSGSVVYIVGQNTGSSNIIICENNSSVCGTLYITVNGLNGGLTFSPTSVNVTQNQSAAVTVTGGSGSYYLSSNTNPSAAAVSLQNGSLNITGLNSGTTSLTVCQNNDSTICGTLVATIGSATASSGSISFSNASPSLTVGQSQAITINGGNSSSATYYISSISNASAISLNLSGATLNLTGNVTGTSSISICQTGSSVCASLTVTVTATASNPSPVSLTTTTTPTTQSPATNTLSTFSNGELINENGTTYIVYKNTKTPFSNTAVFLALGYKLKDVKTVTNSGLALSGKVVASTNSGHARGAWLLSGSTVYFLTPQGLIPVPNWNTFLNNGGQANFIVKANSRDMAFSKLSPMTLNDTRLK